MLRHLPAMSHPDLIVGADHFSDAGVFRLRVDCALVQTTDFFPPLVDDPRTFGRIAAANSLSDVYAMGGRPITALNIAAFPDKELPADILVEILAGGADKVLEAGAVIVGGHTIRDAEIKYGLAVTGLVDPRRLIMNNGAKPGDVLILTKPIGSGTLTTAAKKGLIPESDLAECIAVMTQLNRAASEAMMALPSRDREGAVPTSPIAPTRDVRQDSPSCDRGEGITSASGFEPLPHGRGSDMSGSEMHRSETRRSEMQPVGRVSRPDADASNPPLAHAHAATDITGFGLLGHAYEMAEAGGVSIRVFASKVPLMHNALCLAEQGCVTRAHKSTLDHLGAKLKCDGVPNALVYTLADAQTSGGLLVALPPENADAYVAALARAGITAAIIGEVTAHTGPAVIELIT